MSRVGYGSRLFFLQSVRSGSRLTSRGSDEDNVEPDPQPRPVPFLAFAQHFHVGEVEGRVHDRVDARVGLQYDNILYVN